MDSAPPAAVPRGTAAVGAAIAANTQQSATAANSGAASGVARPPPGAASNGVLRGGQAAAHPAAASSSVSDGSKSASNSSATVARQQSGVSHGQRLTIRRVLQQTLRTEGWAGLYRGIGPTVVGILPYAGLKFYVYQSLKQQYRTTMGQSDDQRLPVPLMLTFGAISGLVGQVLRRACGMQS